MRQQDQQQQSRVLYELSVLILNMLRCPPSPMQLWDAGPASSRRAGAAAAPQITAGGLASLLLGMSVALMLSGWLTFMIGFILMPWVLGLVIVFYFLGIVSSLSMLGRSILSHSHTTSTSSSPPPPPPKAWKLL